MKIKLAGYQKLDFTSKEGAQIKGTTLYAIYRDAGDDSVIGHKVEKFFVPTHIKIPESLKGGEDLEIAFNHRGKVEAIAVVPKA